MGFTEAVRSVFNKYATFSGRARRAEYWWFLLFSLIVSAILGVIDGALFGYTFTSDASDGAVSFNLETVGILTGLWSLATFIPSLAVSVRRLHDTGRSGWWLLIGLVPLIGIILLIVWFATKGEPATNAHGPDPIGPAG